jgi:hypothetical protein
MRTEECAYILLTAAALIFPCWDQYEEKMVAERQGKKESQLERRVRCLLFQSRIRR